MTNLWSVVSRRDVFDDEDKAAKQQKIREARLKAARGQHNWTEITPAERLVPRGPARFGWLVDAASDRLWRVSRGSVFEPGTARVVATHSAETFYVSRDGDVVALEPAEPFSTWSEVVARRPELVVK